MVYLHGRRQTNLSGSIEVPGLVLSSGDFGRAYLADGWATRFFKQLLEQRFVVLLGYSAGDPPVRYLLEGLGASPSATRERIFAFDRGEPLEVKNRWEHLGVTAIACTNYDLLWNSLEAWAKRADDPTQWKKGIVQLAQNSPRSLQAFERGQVATLVATTSGAKSFSFAKSPPPAEWLCVLDNSIRFQDAWRDLATGTGTDPLAAYGLDDDPPPSPPSPYKSSSARGLDLLVKLPEDECRYQDRLANTIPGQSRRGNKRLQALSFWLSRVAHEPTAIWWATRQAYLHPTVIDAISSRFHKGSPQPIEGEARRIWALLLEIESDKPADPHEFRWNAACEAVEIAGWSPQTLRQIERALRPRLEVKPTRFLSAPPVLEDITEAKLTKLARFEVRFPRIDDGKLAIEQDSLPQLFECVRRRFERATSLLSDTGAYMHFFHLAAIEPEERAGNRYVDPEGPDPLFFWSLRLFDQLAEHHPAVARKEALGWPDPDRFFFDKLRIYVWTKTDIFSSREIAQGIVNLTDDTFWNSYLKREFLHLLRAQWANLPHKLRRVIERRILTGRPQYPLEEAEQYEDRRERLSGTYLGWLERQGCQLLKATQRILRELRSRTDWRSSWEESADGDMDGRTGMVEKHTDARDLESLPVRLIAQRVREQVGEYGSPFVENIPFEGLVKAQPRRALRVLTFEARNGRYPTDLWSTALHKWPEDKSIRPKRILARRLAFFPQASLLKMRYEIPNWISKHLVRCLDLRGEVFLVWDALFEALRESAPSSTQSHIGEVNTAGSTQKTRKTHEHAINSPVGQLVEALLKTIDTKNKTPCPLPLEITDRLVEALYIPGEGADHAMSILAMRLEWLYWKDPAWAATSLLSAFDLASPRCEAAWRGYLSHRRNPPEDAELFARLKSSFLGLIENRSYWLEEGRLARTVSWFLVIATYWRTHDSRYIAAQECRRALQYITDQGREHALWTLGEIVAGQDGSVAWARDFFRAIWPQETRFQTSGTSGAMVDIASRNQANFPDLVDIVLEYLRPHTHPHGFLYVSQKASSDTDGRSLVEKHPSHALAVAGRLIGSEPQDTPYDLGTFLNKIAEVDKELSRSPSWRRLHDLVHG